MIREAGEQCERHVRLPAAAGSTLFFPDPHFPWRIVFVTLDPQTMRPGRVHVRNLPAEDPCAAGAAEEMETLSTRPGYSLHPVCTDTLCEVSVRLPKHSSKVQNKSPAVTLSGRVCHSEKDLGGERSRGFAPIVSCWRWYRPFASGWQRAPLTRMVDGAFPRNCELQLPPNVRCRLKI